MPKNRVAWLLKSSVVSVVKKDGTKEDFNVQKVISAISKSAERAMITFSKAELNFICEFVEEKVQELDQELIPIPQMHNIVEERPHLHKTVERRLLMPSFNGNDIIFPMDGPLGRCGPSLQATIECPPTDEDWGRCSHNQLTMQDQCIWLQKLCNIIPEQC